MSDPGAPRERPRLRVSNRASATGALPKPAAVPAAPSAGPPLPDGPERVPGAGRPRVPRRGVTPEAARRRRQLAVRLTAAALVWTLGVLITALALPVYNNRTITNGNGLTLTSATYVQVNGGWFLIPIALGLVAIGSVAWALARPAAPATRWTWLPVAALWLVGLATIVDAGGVLLVTALLLTLAAVAGRRPGALRPQPRSATP